jgi:ATP-dependent RNA helicase RhlE
LSFDKFQLTHLLLDGLDTMGYEQPTPIQDQVIPHILEGKDVIACAQTGTGKTAAYLLPVLHKISENNIPHTSALIISPTRELALQIDNAFQGFSYFTHASSIAVYGGGDGITFEREKKALTQGASVVIATPGRLLSHLNMGYVKFNQLDFLILDEADKMLDMGFYDDIVRIIGFIPAKRQNLLFSATMPPRMRELAKKIMHSPVEINIALSKPAAGILQQAILLYDNQKTEMLKRIITEKHKDKVLIFASTKIAVKDLEKELRKLQLPARAIHSDLTQDERENVLMSFRNNKANVLVATDILSRGIDIEDIDLVINYDVPGDAEDYIHRIGRTARAAAKGEAITFVNPRDMRKFSQIEKLIEREVVKLPVPENMGKQPEWNPDIKESRPNFRRNQKRPFKKKGKT